MGNEPFQKVVKTPMATLSILHSKKTLKTLTYYIRPESICIIYAEQGFFRVTVDIGKQILVARSQFACFASEEGYQLSILIDKVKPGINKILLIEINVDKQAEHSFYFEMLKSIVKKTVATVYLTSIALQAAFISITEHIDPPDLSFIDIHIGFILASILGKTEDPVNDIQSKMDIPGEGDLAFLIAEMIIIEMDEDWPIEKLARRYQINIKKLKEIFKRHVGMPVATFKISVRMQKARQLLEETALSIQDISLQVGYPDPAHFSKLFKQKMGASPSSIRKKLRIQRKRPRD
jgi:AraC-like DNA-binding protein